MIGNSDFDGIFYVAGYYCGFPNDYVSGFWKRAARDAEISRLGFPASLEKNICKRILSLADRKWN
jgi:hypothetical protein